MSSLAVFPIATILALLWAPFTQCATATRAATAPATAARADEGRRRLWEPSGSYVKISDIFWPHIPKTSTTFARTIFSYACGEESDDFALYATNRPPSPKRGMCTGRLAVAQDELLNRTSDSLKTWFHTPVPWTKGKDPVPTVHAITLLRKPAERLHSEFAHMSSTWVCCGADDPQRISSGLQLSGQGWGWDARTRLAAANAAHGQVELRRTGRWKHDPELTTSVARLRRYRDLLDASDSLYGCQTKMLIGRGCHESHKLTDKEVEMARQYVTSSIALPFVGLLERYGESVCLFHAMYGSPLYEFEVLLGEEPDNVWPPRPRVLARANEAAQTSAAEFEGGDADPDEEIYALAQQRFEAALEQHRNGVNECLHVVQRAQARQERRKGASEHRSSAWSQESAAATKEEAVDVLVLPRVVPEWALANQSELDVKEPPSELAPSKHAMRRRPAGKLRALIPAAPPSHGVHADPEHAAAEEQAAAAAAKAAKAEDDAAAKAARASKRRARKELSKKGAKVATEEERVGWQEMPEAIPKRFAAKHSPRKTKSSTSASYSGRTPLTLHPHPDSRAPREHAVFVSYRQ